MTLVHRVLFPHPIESFDEYLARGGGAGYLAAQERDADALIAELQASGLRGRGGAGFPTGVKWRTVADNASPELATTVVVNGAEGEPGTFKDRTILRVNPYEVVEGALIAAQAMGARQVVFALKRTFATEVVRLRAVIAEFQQAGWADDLELIVFEGPDEYLYGEETGLLEAIDGRAPFPRLAPPYRRGVVEVVETDADVDTGSSMSAHVEMAGPGGGYDAPPTLVDNVETMANVPKIIARGAEWFRTMGTDASPGSIVCTVTGASARAGVGEVEMGTPLREVIEVIGNGVMPGRRIIGVLCGASGPVIPADELDVGVSYEQMQAVGRSLGSGSFTVLDDADDPVAVAAGVSRFLAIESCGQCMPCKQDGLSIATALGHLARNQSDETEVDKLRARIDSVTYGARCSLATQHQVVIGSLLAAFPEAVAAHLDGTAAPVEPVLVSELLDIVDDRPVLDERHRDKQPDWGYDGDSGLTPFERFADHRAHEPLEG